MTKREKALFRELKKLRDALWDSGIQCEHGDRLNKAYISANSLITKIEREAAAIRSGKAATE
jgi:hypothetical protein